MSSGCLQGHALFTRQAGGANPCPTIDFTGEFPANNGSHAGQVSYPVIHFVILFGPGLLCSIYYGYIVVPDVTTHCGTFDAVYTP